MKRKITEDLNKWADSESKECLVISGARQVGKSYSVEEFLQSRFESHLTIDFSIRPELKGVFDGDLDVNSIIKKLNLNFPDFRFEPKKTALFLDEIQMCPNARTSLKSFALDGRFAVIASGSLLGIDYSKVPSYPVGYERVMVMRSMDFEEFLWAIGIEEETISYIRTCISSKTEIDDFVYERISDYFRIFMTVGGMPEVVRNYISDNDIGSARSVQKKIVRGYRDDIGEYSAERERNKIFACFDSIPIQLSKENKKFAYSSIPNANSPSARKYRSSIDWINDAGIASLCTNLSEPKMPFEERSDGTSFKVYMNDTGLLMSMMDDDIVKAVIKGDTKVNKGAITENAVAENLLKCGFDLHYFSTASMGIDFIVSMHGSPVAIEVKSGNNRRSKSLTSIKENYHVNRRMKFENTNILTTEDGVEHYPLFASAFSDSMYVKQDLKAELKDADDVNKRVSKISG